MESSCKNSLLICIDWYYPGQAAGGPITSVSNLKELLKDKYDITILTSNKDLNAKIPYEGMEASISSALVGGVKVIYLSRANYRNLLSYLKLKYDNIYLNGLFSIKFTLIPLLLNKFKIINSNLILAPRGMLHKSAMSSKSLKKNFYFFVTKFLFTQKNIRYHATNTHEKKLIHKTFGNSVNVSVINNAVKIPSNSIKNMKIKGRSIRLIYASRICKHKNLAYVLKNLLAVSKKIKINIDIYGLIEDKKYWKKCKNIIDKFSKNISAKYCGLLGPDNNQEILQENHFLVLMTKGENFGHIIYESLAAGRPVIISEKTPWSEIEHLNIGYLSNFEDNNLLDIFEGLINIDDESYSTMCYDAKKYAKDFFDSNDFICKYNQLLEN